MNLYDFTPDTAAIIEKAFNHPVMKIKPRAAKPFPEMDDAIKATVNAIEHAVIEGVAAKVTPLLDDALLAQVLMDGDYEDQDNPNEWTSALDDRVEKAIEEYVPILSADWLGKNTIDSGIQGKEGVYKFAMSMGREVFKQLTYAMDKSPAKIMSAAGITTSMLEAQLTIHNQPKEDTDMDQQQSQLDALIAKIVAHVGKDYDIMTVYEDLDLASDDDDNLAVGAAARLGLEADDVEVLQIERLTHGDETPQMLADRLKEAADGKAPEKKQAAKKPAAKKPAAKTPAAKPAPAKKETSGAVSAEMLQKFKNAATFKDADVAQRLGVSRATFNNWVNGKTAAELSNDQAAALRDEIVVRLNALHECLAELDDNEAHVVF